MVGLQQTVASFNFLLDMLLFDKLRHVCVEQITTIVMNSTRFSLFVYFICFRF